MLPDCSKLAITWKNDNDVTIFPHVVIVRFFWCYFVFLVKFSYSKFHVNIITGSGVMTIFFYKGLTRNPKIENTPICVVPNIWRLVQVRDTKCGMNVSRKVLLNTAKWFTAFIVSELLKENQHEGKFISPPPFKIRVKYSEFLIRFLVLSSWF